jgi:integrase
MPKQKQAAAVKAAQHYRPLTESQLSQILVMTEKDPKLSEVHDVVTMIITTGMRVREMRDLRWADVDFAQREITIKPGTPDARTVPFEDKARLVFKKRRLCEPQAEYVLGESPQKLLNRVSRKLAAISTGLGIERVSFHILRRTFAHRLFSAGASIIVVMRILGYKGPFQGMLRIL